MPYWYQLYTVSDRGAATEEQRLSLRCTRSHSPEHCSSVLRTYLCRVFGRAIEDILRVVQDADRRGWKICGEAHLVHEKFPIRPAETVPKTSGPRQNENTHQSVLGPRRCVRGCSNHIRIL